MQTGNIGDSVICVGLACAKDLPDIKYKKTKFTKGLALRDMPQEDALRRPAPHETEVYSFPQQWSSTALGFGGMGGAAMTTAQTTVVLHRRSAAVYFGTQFAYAIPSITQEFMDDVRRHRVAACDEVKKYGIAPKENA